MNQVIFKTGPLTGFPELITEPYSGQVGVDARGQFYQYFWKEEGFKPMYHWHIGEAGIYHNWTEEEDTGDGKNYLTFCNGYFYLTSDWNNAEYYGFRWQPWRFADFKRMYHILFDKHFKPKETLRFPAMEEIEKQILNGK